MRKNLLSLSIAAAIGGLGLVGGAHAITSADSTGATADTQNISKNGIGHSLIVPYYAAQTEHATLINLVNTDTVNGKAVKVRFRGAANSDDVYDFQVFLSPGDVWNANVSQDAATGLAKLTTVDNSCTKPANVNGNFVTARLKSTWTAENKAANTREGYVEIFNMADVPPGSPLFTAIKHVDGVAPCNGTAWTYLDTDRNYGEYVAAGLANPSTGLMGNWTIINVNNAAAWGSTTPAVLASASQGSDGLGRIVYFPQVATAVNPTLVDTFTADPLLVGGQIAAALYDLPDMSTPYLTNAGLFNLGVTVQPSEQAGQLTRTISVDNVINEYLTNPDINASTDWVFSMPTRRYNVAMNYTPTTSVPVFNDLLVRWFTADNTAVDGDQICVKNVTYSVWDQSENSPASTIDVVISPNTLPDPVLFCGETSILTINNPGAAQSGVLNAAVTVKDIQTSTYTDGWINLTTPGAYPGNGLPVLGGAFVRATAGASTFGANWDHRFISAGFASGPVNAQAK